MRSDRSAGRQVATLPSYVLHTTVSYHTLFHTFVYRHSLEEHRGFERLFMTGIVPTTVMHVRFELCSSQVKSCIHI